MVSVAVEALLVIVILPPRLPVPEGEKVTLRVALCPEVNICPVETPLTLTPAPEMATLEIVTVDPPVFVIVTGRLLLALVDTFPKFKLVVLGLSWPAEFTVNVAVLLVAFPAEFVTTTVNWGLLSALVAAGVV
jgi:hypothetical protein